MTQILDEQVSALLDDELPPDELPLLLARLERDAAARATLGRYAMIGECLRGGAVPAGLVLAERVRAELAAETPAAGPALRERRRLRAGWVASALAASLAAAALLTVVPRMWSADNGTVIVASTAATPQLVEEPLGGVTATANRRLAPDAAARLTGYMVAHGVYASSLSRNTFDSRLVSARAERASWRQPQVLADDVP